MLTRNDESAQSEQSYIDEDQRLLEPKMIWLFGPHPRITYEYAWGFLNSQHKYFDVLRIWSNVPNDEPMVPIFPNTRDRSAFIEHCMLIPDLHLLVIGCEEDQENEEFHEFFPHSFGLYVHPEELDFQAKFVSDASPMLWKEALEEKKRWEAFLEENFENWSTLS